MQKMYVHQLKPNKTYRMDLPLFHTSHRVIEGGYNRIGGTQAKDVFTEPLFFYDADNSRLSFLKPGQSICVTRSDTFYAELLESALDFSVFWGAKRGNTATGWDPEVFVVDENNELIPAFKFLPSKEDPFHISGMPPCESKAYWDGFQAEFSTIPYSCHESGFNGIQAGLRTVRTQARQKNPKAKLTIQSVFRLLDAQLRGYDEKYVALGCKPSLSAYDTDPFTIDNPFELPYRMAGGHIHFGMRNGAPSLERAKQLAKFLDLIVGIPTVGMFAEIDDPIRRRYYGRAGEFRLPKHGLEYRTLSNAWMGHPSVGFVIMDLSRRAIGNLVDNFRFDSLGISEEEVRDIIDSTDVEAARKLFQANSVIWKNLISSQYSAENAWERFSQIVQDGVEMIYPNYRDIEHNWSLDELNRPMSWAVACSRRRL